MNRRNFLTAAGATLILPKLESFADKKNKSVHPKMVFLGMGYGFTNTFYPDTFGKDYKLTKLLQPLASHKNNFTMINNLWHKFSQDPHGGCTSYLTGANVDGTPGKRFANTISCDQVAAKYLGKDTRYSSIQLSGEGSNGFSGYGKGLSLSWNENGNPISGILEPFKLYAKLFGGDEISYEQRLALLKQRRSILDAFVNNMKSLSKHSSKVDRDKLAEYFQSIREIELAIEKEKMWASKPKPRVSYPKPPQKLNGETELKTVYDLIALALQTDSTRVISYRQPLKSVLAGMGVTYDGHQLSHHHGSAARTKASEQKDLKLMELFSYFIDKLKSVKEVNGTSLFDNTLVSLGSNLRTGHMLKNVPAIVTGNIDGKIKHGRHIEMPKETALCNLWLTILNTCNVPVKQFGDSTGTISELYG